MNKTIIYNDRFFIQISYFFKLVIHGYAENFSTNIKNFYIVPRGRYKNLFKDCIQQSFVMFYYYSIRDNEMSERSRQYTIIEDNSVKKPSYTTIMTNKVLYIEIKDKKLFTKIKLIA